MECLGRRIKEGYMSDLLQQIEALRTRMHEAHDAGDMAGRLAVSQELDRLIVELQRGRAG